MSPDTRRVEFIVTTDQLESALQGIGAALDTGFDDETIKAALEQAAASDNLSQRSKVVHRGQETSIEISIKRADGRWSFALSAPWEVLQDLVPVLGVGFGFNSDTDDLRGYLTALAGDLDGGFSKEAALQLLDYVGELGVGTQLMRTYDVSFRGEDATLTIDLNYLRSECVDINLYTLNPRLMDRVCYRAQFG